jgi:hypothetical protein
MKKIPLLFLSICSIPSFGQKVSFSVHAGVSVPFIATVEKSISAPMVAIASVSENFRSVNLGAIQEKYDAKGGLNLSGTLDIKASGFFFSTGLGVQVLRFNRSEHITNLSEDVAIRRSFDPNLNLGGSPLIIGFDTSGGFRPIQPMNESVLPSPNGSVTNTFIRMPFLIGRSFFKNKVTISGGVTFSYLLHASAYEQYYDFTSWGQAQSTLGYQRSVTESKINAKERFTILCPGLVGELAYHISIVSLHLTFQRNLNPIYVSEYQSAGKAKLNILTLGVGCRLTK